MTTVAKSPFLGAGVGDTLFMISAWQKTSLTDSRKERGAEVYSKVAVSMTVTTLMNVLAFLTGDMTSFKSGRYF